MDYTKFERDLREVVLKVREHVKDIPDNGTCNLDSIVISLPRANEAKVLEAIENCGCYGHKSKWMGSIVYFLNIPSGGQADKRACAITKGIKELKELGYKVYGYYQMD